MLCVVENHSMILGILLLLCFFKFSSLLMSYIFKLFLIFSCFQGKMKISIIITIAIIINIFVAEPLHTVMQKAITNILIYKTDSKC